MDDPIKENILDIYIERQINSFESSYVNTYNRLLSRKGGLFQSPFRRLEIMDEAHLQQAIIYTHANAQKHKIVKDFKEYPYSSYYEILNTSSLVIATDQVLQFFRGKDKFIMQHEKQVQYYYSNHWPASKLEVDD